MTYPRDFRNTPTHAIQNDIGKMNDQRLGEMMDYVGPEIPNHAKDVIQSELDKRHYDRMATAADDARKDGFSPSKLGQSELEPMDQLDGFDDDSLDVGPADIPAETFDPDPVRDTIPDIDGGEAQGIDLATDTEVVESVQADTGLSEDEAKAVAVAIIKRSIQIEELLAARRMIERIVGVIVMEAYLLTKATERLEAILRQSDEVRVLSHETIERLLSHLWKEYDPDERKKYLEPIFEEDEQAVLSIVKDLAEEAGLGVEDR